MKSIPSNKEKVETNSRLKALNAAQKSVASSLGCNFNSLSHIMNFYKLPKQIFDHLIYSVLHFNRSCTTFLNFFVLNQNDQERFAKQLFEKAVEFVNSKNANKLKRKNQIFLTTWFEQVKELAQSERVKFNILSYFGKSVKKGISWKEIEEKCPNFVRKFENRMYVYI